MKTQVTSEKVEQILDASVAYLLYAMIFFIPISKAIIEVLFTLAAVLFIIKKIIKPDLKFLKDNIYLFILLFIIFNALSLINSGVYLDKSLHALFLKWCKYIFVFVVTVNTLNSKKRLENAVLVIFVISTLIGVDAIIQRFSGIDFFRHRTLISGKVTASFENPNSFGVYLVPVLLFVTALVFQPTPKRNKLFIVFLMVILGRALILTFARGAWFSFSLGLIFLAAISRQAKKYIPIIAIWIFLLLLIPATQQRIFKIFLRQGDADRIALWLTSLRMIRDNPFLGKGIGTYMAHFREYADISGIYYAHNCFLQIWAEGGIFSLFAFLLFVGLIMYRAMKALRENTNFLLLGFACGLFGYLVNSFFDTSLYSLQLAFLFWLMLGLLAALTKLETGPKNIFAQT